MWSLKIARAFKMSETTQAIGFLYQRLLTGFIMMVFFANLSLTEFLVWVLALFLHFLDSFFWVLIGTLCSIVLLILGFFKNSLLAPLFSYHALMFLIICNIAI